ncbi:MAG: hypothetical protein Q8O66_02735, partial [bacterium]|nr:hypothetical protein [bacterium]
SHDNWHNQVKEEAPVHQSIEKQEESSLYQDKIEEISFRSSKRNTEKTMPDNRQIKRKEVNLSELKKALEESLEEIKKEPVLKNVNDIEDKKDVEPSTNGEKRVINPGEKVKF